MFFIKGTSDTLFEIQNEINNTFSNNELIVNNIKIDYILQDFKKDLEKIIKLTKGSLHHNIIKQIIDIEIKELTQEKFNILLKQSFNEYSYKYLEINPKILNHHKIIKRLCQILKFLLNLKLNINKNSLYGQHILHFIDQADYGILKRIKDFFSHLYRCWFFIILIQIISKGLMKLKIDNHKKSEIIISFFQNYLNINHAFDLNYLQYNLYTNYYNIKNTKDIQIQYKNIIDKEHHVLEAINEIIFGAAQDIIIKNKININNVFYSMFENELNFNEILTYLENILFIILKISYPEYEMEYLCDYLENFMSLFNTTNNFIDSTACIITFLNGFFKYIAISSLTPHFYISEIIGYIQYSLPLKNILLSDMSTIVFDPDFIFVFIKERSNTNIFQILEHMNSNKLHFLIQKLIEERTSNTYLKIFKMYKKYLSKSEII